MVTVHCTYLILWKYENEIIFKISVAYSFYFNLLSFVIFDLCHIITPKTILKQYRSSYISICLECSPDSINSFIYLLEKNFWQESFRKYDWLSTRHTNNTFLQKRSQSLTAVRKSSAFRYINSLRFIWLATMTMMFRNLFFVCIFDVIWNSCLLAQHMAVKNL